MYMTQSTNLVDWESEKLAELIVSHCSHVRELVHPVRAVLDAKALKVLATLASLQSLTSNREDSQHEAKAKVSLFCVPVHGPDAQL